VARVRRQISQHRTPGTWPNRRIVIFQAAIVAAVLGVLAPPHGDPIWAAPLDTVGVVDFYMVGPAPAISGLIPGRFAADDLAQLLPKVAHRPIKVIPREILRETEASMGWRTADVAHADRLTELARQVGAIHLITGRIERLYTQGRSGGRMGGSPVQATANIQVQVFDASHRRFEAGAPGEGYAVGSVQRVVAQQALHQANAAALPRALKKLTPGQ
jgi:hypothetical protein